MPPAAPGTGDRLVLLVEGGDSAVPTGPLGQDTGRDAGCPCAGTRDVVMGGRCAEALPPNTPGQVTVWELTA